MTEYIIYYVLGCIFWIFVYTDLFVKKENRETFKEDGLSIGVVNKYGSALLLFVIGFLYFMKETGIIE